MQTLFLRNKELDLLLNVNNIESIYLCLNGESINAIKITMVSGKSHIIKYDNKEKLMEKWNMLNEYLGNIVIGDK